VGRVVDRGTAAAAAARARDEGGTVVFTNGCFDILHRGHVDLLRSARSEGDLLVVGLNTDASVRRLKGEGRPLVPEEDRAAVVAALESVDLVVLFDEDTPLALIRELRPEVLVKGADYRMEDVVGGEDVTGWGGRVRLVPLTEGRSTSGLLKRLAGEQDRTGR
jgi:D-beta-D-heptose 7-phosphate kinase/D-beta-D-heptose 1-phosphate adenosyltransferase